MPAATAEPIVPTRGGKEGNVESGWTRRRPFEQVLGTTNGEMICISTANGALSNTPPSSPMHGSYSQDGPLDGGALPGSSNSLQTAWKQTGYANTSTLGAVTPTGSMP